MRLGTSVANIVTRATVYIVMHAAPKMENLTELARLHRDKRMYRIRLCSETTVRTFSYMVHRCASAHAKGNFPIKREK